MKFEILTDILFELLAKRKLTAKHIAERYGLSERTIYRYLAKTAEGLRRMGCRASGSVRVLFRG